MSFNPWGSPQRPDYFMFLPLRIPQGQPIYSARFP